ncbi:MAG TPA: hypothetical protein VJ851_01500 [Jatrophihabitans sp.]|nr:hypothetical protein [Jatrophihabitans sp.]
MTGLRIDSIDEPFLANPSLVEQALRLLLRAEYVGCLPDLAAAIVLGPEVLRSVGRCMQHAQLPSARWSFLTGPEADLSPAQWRTALTAMNDQIEMSPLPDGEWGPVLSTLGEDLVADLLGISASSIRRYHAGARSTPQEIAERLHFVALLLADLAGSYNDYGLRRWFTRPRTALADRRPIELLGGNFDPDGPDAHALKELAASLSAAGAA